jgi:SAM-dependent methyltransferase
MDDAVLLAEQLDYYRARAREYDQWWLRQGQFDRGADANAQWFEEAAALEQALEQFHPAGDVLELACGTGLWTRHLVGGATRLTAVDGSSEVLALNRERLGGAPVQYLQADLFEWQPAPAAHDVCFFGFWLSHVPEERFAAFWETVRTALRPGGRVFFVDSARASRATAVRDRLPAPGEDVMTRRLNDGREFRVVKRYYEPRRLEQRLTELGWNVDVRATGEFFIYGFGSPGSPG